MTRYLLLVLIPLAAEIPAQISFNYSGYFLDLPIYQINSGELTEYFDLKEEQFINLSRFRFRPEVILWTNARITVEYEINSLYFTSPSAFEIGGTGKTNRQIVDLSWSLVRKDKFIANHFIDRFYYRQDFTWGNLIAGRQRISWGTGRIWNPVDLFNPINPANFYKIEKDGADALSLKYYLGSFSDLNIVFNPRERIAESNYALRFRTNFSEYDISGMIGHFDKKLVLGTDFAGNLMGAGVRGEFLLSADENSIDDNFIKFILGTDYQFSSKIYGLIEFHFNGEGKSDKSDYEIERLAKGEIINLSRYYFYSSMMYQINPLINLNLFNNHGFNDASGFVGIIGIYAITDFFDVGLGFQHFYGDEFSEYWYYSNVSYLQFQIYY